MSRPCSDVVEGGSDTFERHWQEAATYASLWEASGWAQHRDGILGRDMGGASTAMKVWRWEWDPGGAMGVRTPKAPRGDDQVKKKEGAYQEMRADRNSRK